MLDSALSVPTGILHKRHNLPVLVHGRSSGLSCDRAYVRCPHHCGRSIHLHQYTRAPANFRPLGGAMPRYRRAIRRRTTGPGRRHSSSRLNALTSTSPQQPSPQTLYSRSQKCLHSQRPTDSESTVSRGYAPEGIPNIRPRLEKVFSCSEVDWNQASLHRFRESLRRNRSTDIRIDFAPSRKRRGESGCAFRAPYRPESSLAITLLHM